MGVILPGVDGTGFPPQFFRGIGTGRDTFLWEWDGTGLKIHSRVTLYFIGKFHSEVCIPLPHSLNEKQSDFLIIFTWNIHNCVYTGDYLHLEYCVCVYRMYIYIVCVCIY